MNGLLSLVLAGMLAQFSASAFPRDTSILLGVQSGFLTLASSKPFEASTKTGVEGNLRLIASHEWEKWLLDLAGGYQFSHLTGIAPIFGNQVKVVTRTFSAEISPRWKFMAFNDPGFQIGPVVQVLAGGDVSYDEDGTVDSLTTQFRAGAKGIYQWGKDFIWRIGASVMTDLNIKERSATAFLIDFQFGLTPNRKPLEAEVPHEHGYPEFAEVKDRSIRVYLGEALLSFPLGSDRIGTKAKEALASLAPVLIKNGDSWSKIRIEGHTDSRDQNHQNQALSERRARSVAAELIALQIPENRISSAGFGASRPIDSGTSEEAFLLNRRVEIWIDEVDLSKIKQIMTEIRQMK